MDVNNSKVLFSKQTIFLIVGILLISVFIIGGTYAYLIYNIEITNKNIASSTTCFDIVYDADNDSTPITGTLIPTSGPGGGLSGKISIGLSANCINIDAYGSFYLNVTTGSNILLQKVDAHCENSQTLRTLTNYTTPISCESQTNGKWVTSGSALKYALYTTNDITSTTVPLQVGYISKTEAMAIYNNFVITTTTVDYYIYVWLDGNLIDNSYSSQSFAGNISVAASQVETSLLYGDANLDGVVDLDDVDLIVKYYSEEIELSSAALVNADVNLDGEVDLTDFALISRYCNGELDSLPVT